MQQQKNKPIIFYPIIYAASSVLALFAHNLGEVVFFAIVRSLIFTIVFGLIVLGVFRLIFKNWQRAGFFATWSLLLFFNYGHIYNLLRQFGLGNSIGRHRYLLSFWGLLFVFGTLFFVRTIKDFRPITIILNTVSLTLIVISLVSIGRYYFVRSRAESVYEVNTGDFQITLEVPQNPPDIYYLIFDGYARSDVLAEKFGFDNSEFLSKLEDMGFYIADCSRSNYRLTQLTLSTMLNMAYADELFGEIPRDATMENVPLENFTKTNRVMTILKTIGYETVAFETSYHWSHLYDVDFYYAPTPESLYATSLSRFEEMYLDTTIISVVLDWHKVLMVANIKPPVMPRENHFNRINFVFDTLRTIPELEGPQFIFAHMIIPHAPYIFTEEGLIPDLNLYSPERELGQSGQEGYINNIRFINKEVIGVIEEILSQSVNEPIIILQSDHGSFFFDKTMNFSAFYFPDEGEAALYPSITPVNTFRVLFNQYFNADLTLLPDMSFEGETGVFDFVPVEETYPFCIVD